MVELGIELRNPATMAGDARQAEEFGYDFVSTGEHVFCHGPVNNGLVVLAAAAGATRTIGLMSAITLAPLLAKEVGD